MTSLLKYMTPIFLLLLLVGCEDKGPPVVEEVIRPAKFFTVVAPGQKHLRSFPGAVTATDEAELAFRVSGELVEFPARRGLQVKQGELLARLDPTDYEAELQHATAQFNLAKSQLNRVSGLVEKQLISQADYDAREAEYIVSQSSLTRAQNNLDYTRIHAPFNGRVATVMVENFETIGAGQVVLVLQTGEMVDVVVDIPEAIIARFERSGAQQNPHPVSVRFDSAGSELFEGWYKEHETRANPATLTFKVTFSLPAPQSITVLPGMTATVIADLSHILTGDSDNFLVPIESVFAAEDEDVNSPVRYIWKIDPETTRAHRTEVTVGSLTGDSIVVQSGVEGGDIIVAAGVNAVYENMPLRPLTREAGL
jgi:RND family efflux transporter MFP subunit